MRVISSLRPRLLIINMLNKNSSFYKPRQIDFTVMGLDDQTSNFLNWTLLQRDNLEWLKECGTLEKVSSSVVLHFDHLKAIKDIDDVIKHKRA